MLIVKSDPEKDPLGVSEHDYTEHCKKYGKVFEFIEDFVIEDVCDDRDKNRLCENKHDCYTEWHHKNC